MKDKIWLSSPHMGGQEQDFVNKAFEENWVAPLGPNVNGLEEDMAQYLKVNQCAALNSGTGAIHIALTLAGVKAGDFVLCSTFTFCASANPIKYVGAHPVFVDSEEQTWNCDPRLLEEAIVTLEKKGNKPKAFVLVHLYGMPSQMTEIVAICQKYDVALIEDAAEALGSTYQGQKIGTFGDFGIFSFNGNKIITTSGGGALVAKKQEMVQQARFLATQARDDAPHYQHSQIGFNYRMSNISAGIGRGQMLVLDQWIANRRNNFAYYEKELADLPIQFLPEPKGMFSNRWLTCVLFDSYDKREQVRLALEQKNIESRPLWKPMHQQPVFEKECAFTNGVSEKLFEKGLCLPSGSNLTEEDLSRVVSIIVEQFK